MCGCSRSVVSGNCSCSCSVGLAVYHLSIWLSTYLSTYLSICLSASFQTKLLFCETSSVFELDKIRSAEILQDFHNVWTWQAQKRSKSAKFPSKMTSRVQSWRPRTAFCDFSTPSNVLRLLLKKWYQMSYQVLHLSRKIILANLKIWSSKVQPVSGNQHPDLLASLTRTYLL